MPPQESWVQSLIQKGPDATLFAALLFVGLVAGCVGTGRTGHWIWRLVLVVSAVLWPLPDHPLQGPILVSLSYQHGIHLADLLSIVAVVVALLPWNRRQSPGAPARATERDRPEDSRR